VGARCARACSRGLAADAWALSSTPMLPCPPRSRRPAATAWRAGGRASRTVMPAASSISRISAGPARCAVVRFVLDSWFEVDESPSSTSDLFDSPASWFSEEDGLGSLAGLCSAPLSSCSITHGPALDEGLAHKVEAL
jgi:hypothetical protein